MVFGFTAAGEREHMMDAVDQAILRRLQGLRFVGMDVVEVAPAYDVAEITALAGATMAWEYLCLLGLGL